MATCDYCQCVGHAIEASDTRQVIKPDPHFDGDETIALGTLGELQERKKECKTCEQIVRHLLSKKSSQEAVDPETAPHFYVLAKGLRGLPLLKIGSSNAGFEHGLDVDPHWIDIDKIRSWLHTCNSTHRQLCQEPPDRLKLRAEPAVILVDVLRQCLVETHEAGRYIALSYVWGRVPGFDWTTVETFEALKEPGSLERARVPGTVRDAMQLTEMLGERFLWVDRFSVIQNDGSRKVEQIKNMDRIYANSYLTIVSASGSDCNHGLPGIGSGSLPREFEPEYLEFLPGCRLYNRDLGKNATTDSAWSTRAWTFQEERLSRRMLRIGNGMVDWICQQCVQSEDVSEKKADITFRGHYGRGGFLRWPQFELWASNVIQYQKRFMTEQGDVLNAFHGFLSALSFAFPEGFIHGMPLVFLDLALLWQPKTVLNRRPGFPSWSWAGWKGALQPNLTAWESGDNYLKLDRRYQTTWETIPLVQWRISREDSDERQEIETSYHQYRHLATDTSQSLPPGWTRHEQKSGETLEGQVDDTYYFTHEAIDVSEFRYPLPMPESDNSLPPIDGWAPYLFFQTKVSWLNFGDIISAEPDGGSSVLALTGQDGTWAGLIRLNIPEHETASLHGTACELIAISTGRVRNDGNESRVLEEWKLDERPKTGEFYEFYNVLWMEWEDGIAFRRALGRVFKEVWDARDKKIIDVTLG